MDAKLPGPRMIFVSSGGFIRTRYGLIHPIKDFWMDETPVTVAQYREAVEAGACAPPMGGDKFKSSNWGVPGRENHPVNCIVWAQANAYAKWAGKRLPTEEEWEWAATNRLTTIYPWGNERPRGQLCWSGLGNDTGGLRKMTSPVGSFPQGNSSGGIKDLAGNVWEWTSSPSITKRGVEIRRVCGGGFRATSQHDLTGDVLIYSIPAEDLGFRCVFLEGCAMFFVTIIIKSDKEAHVPNLPTPVLAGTNSFSMFFSKKEDIHVLTNVLVASGLRYTLYIVTGDPVEGSLFELI